MMRWFAIIILWLAAPAAGAPADSAGDLEQPSGLPQSGRGTIYGAIGVLDPLVNPGSGARALVGSLANQFAPSASSEFEVIDVKRSLAGVHVGLEQRWDGVRVARGLIGVHALSDGRVFAVHNNAVADVQRGARTIDVATATALAQLSAPGLLRAASFVYLAAGGLGRPAFEISLEGDDPPSRWTVYVSSLTGEILDASDRLLHATAEGQVWTNPITEARNPDLRDGPVVFTSLPVPGVRPAPDFSRYYSKVRLVDLKEGPLGATLDGPYARVSDGLARGTALVFPRDDPRFEEVMAYYWVDWSQRHVQRLGFHDTANFSVDLRMHQSRGFAPLGITSYGAAASSDTIWFGSMAPIGSLNGWTAAFDGFVDSAEDADVILHEYGHVVHLNQLCCGWPTSVILEGFADYWYATQIAQIRGTPYATCGGEWITSYTWNARLGPLPCARNVQNNMTYDPSAKGNGHFVGQTWSGALWDLRTKWGATVTDRLVLESNYLLPQGAGPREAAEALLLADLALHGGAHAEDIVIEMGERNVTGLRVTQEVLNAIAGYTGPSISTETRTAPTLGMFAALAVALGVVLSRRHKQA